MHAASLREKALLLRQSGHSYSHISSETGLSKSTLSGWLAEVPYMPNDITLEAIGKARAASGKRKSDLKQESITAARQEAAKELGQVSSRDLFMFGLGLYLGEGSKTNDITRIVNSDPRVLRLAIEWFMLLGVPKRNFAIRIHLYPDSNLQESLQFWSKMTTIPIRQFQKPQIDRRSGKKIHKLGKLPNGTAHLTVRGMGEKRLGSFLARKIKGFIEEVARQVDTRV